MRGKVDHLCVDNFAHDRASTGFSTGVRATDVPRDMQIETLMLMQGARDVERALMDGQATAWGIVAQGRPV